MCLSAKDRQKLTKAGYTMIRTDKRDRQIRQSGIFGEDMTVKTVTNYVIKQSTQEQFSWHDRNICDTKADLDRRLERLLSDPKVILDE